MAENKTPESVPTPEQSEAQKVGVDFGDIQKVTPKTELPLATPVVTPAPVPAPTPAQDVVEENEAVEIKKDKEYIQKAEQIIKEFQNRPHEEEEQAEDLQIKFLRAKYGKDVNKSVEE